ncbi:MAG: ATP-binding cassette domain-containing protein [Lachnospiraceae bacterium]
MKTGKKEIEGNEITLENVSFSYNREILKDASFSMDHRAKILLRGANGAGKSTLLKLLTGLERPEKGRSSPRKSEGRGA